MIPSDFWISEESLLLLNPRFDSEVQNSLKTAVKKYEQASSVWLKSSGTESGSMGHKLVCLKKEAILHAAQSVNQFFQISEKDCWLNPLPLFHIGGLSIGARCFLSGAREVQTSEKWDPIQFSNLISKESVTITSLVPTQVYDLVENNLTAPDSLRLVLVGGGALKKELYLKARDLGWSLIPSYGMTETCAVLASAPLESLDKREFPEAILLPHVQLEKEGEKYTITSKALFSGFLMLSQQGEEQWLERPEPFVLDDRLELNGNVLRFLGRENELIKVLGESVNLLDLANRIKESLKVETLLIPTLDERRGFNLTLVVESEITFDLNKINQDLMSYEKVEDVIYQKSLPRTALGKIDVSAIKKIVAG